MTDMKLLMLGSATAILILLIIVLMVMIKKKAHPQKTEFRIDDLLINQLVSALGGIGNIRQAGAEHQRLTISLNNAKTIDPMALKATGLPAVLAKNDIKILVKGNADAVANHINHQRNGDHT